jgi:hypothetical protein
VNRTIEIFEADLERARRARSDLDDAVLIEQALDRGAALVTRAMQEPSENQGLDEIRVDLAEAVAEASAYRWSLVTNRFRFAEAGEREQQSYEEHLELERDVVPPLKMEARRLRRELRRLEDEARARDIDLATIEPQIDWSNSVSVDDYAPPRFVSNAERRAANVAFFRRLGER